MLLLFETAAGHALYELKHEDKLKKLDADKLASKLSEDPRKSLSLKTFAPFRDTTEAVAAASDFVESKLNKQLKKFLKKQVPNGGVELGVADPKLGALIKEKLNIPCVASSFVNECLRGARSLAIDGDSSVADAHDVRAMQLGLSHSLSRYKLKFSPDKVDTMVRTSASCRTMRIPRPPPPETALSIIGPFCFKNSFASSVFLIGAFIKHGT